MVKIIVSKSKILKRTFEPSRKQAGGILHFKMFKQNHKVVCASTTIRRRRALHVKHGDSRSNGLS